MKTKKLLILPILISLGIMSSCTSSTSSETTTTESSSSSTTTTTDETSSTSSSSHKGGPSGSNTGGPGGNRPGESSSSEDDSSSSSVTTSTATTLTDTDGNTIYSGSASVSYKYGNQSTTKTLSAAYLINGVDVEISSGSYSSASSSSDQVVFLVINGGSLTITGTSSSYVEVTKSGSAASNGQVGDDYNFYGINSGIVVAKGSTATISYTNISTTSNGSNAVVATNGGAVNISNSTITTSGSAGSRGLHATYSGTITADNVNITTSGASCASLATDRGGGTIAASNMTLETNGAGSPLVYSTGTINVNSSTGTANKSQMVVVEGGSTANLDSCNFSCVGNGNRTGTSESNSSSHTIDSAGIFIYQSTSGDSSEGTDYFTAKNSTLKVTTSGVPMFYLTNITAQVTLNGNTFTQASTSDYLFILEEQNQWGKVGSNGGKSTVSLTNQSVEGYKAFVGTSSSSLTITATDSSSTAISKTIGTW